MEFNDVESMVEKLGPKRTAEAIGQARSVFEANTDQGPKDKRPQPMTVAEWSNAFEGEFDGEEPFDDEESTMVEDATFDDEVSTKVDADEARRKQVTG